MEINKIKKKELLRFLVGGSSAVLVDFLIYHALMLSGLERESAKGISFLCGSIVGFVINKLWTFESNVFLKGEVVKYIILYACTACINIAVNQVVVAFTAIEILGFFIATGVSMVLNFLGQKYFVFHK